MKDLIISRYHLSRTTYYSLSQVLGYKEIPPSLMYTTNTKKIRHRYEDFLYVLHSPQWSGDLIIAKLTGSRETNGKVQFSKVITQIREFMENP